MGKILNKAKYAVVVGGGLLASAIPAAATTGDLVNDTTEAVESLWPLLILFMVLSLVFGILGGMMSKIRMR